MQNKESSNSDLLKYAISYIPLVGIILFFTEENKSKELLKHIKYGTFLFIGFVLIRFIIVGILWIPISGILFLLYAGIAGFFGYKAYNGENIKIDYIDNLEKKVKDNLNDSKKEDKKEDKDILDF